MNNIFYNLGRKRTALLIAALLLCGDIIFGYITVRSLGSFSEFYELWREMVAQANELNPSQGLKDLNSMPKEYFREVYQVIKNVVYSLCFIFGAYHILIYTLLVNEKRFARIYCVVMSFTAALSCLFAMFFSSPIYIIGLASYTFSFMGLLTLGQEQRSQE